MKNENLTMAIRYAPDGTRQRALAELQRMEKALTLIASLEGIPHARNKETLRAYLLSLQEIAEQGLGGKQDDSRHD